MRDGRRRSRKKGRVYVYVGGAGRREGDEEGGREGKVFSPLLKRKRRRYDDQPLV